MMAKKEVKPPDEMKYEEAFQELKELVEKLESDELELDEGLQLFERGQALVRRCGDLLEEADLKIKQITADESGEYAEVDLDLDEEI